MLHREPRRAARTRAFIGTIACLALVLAIAHARGVCAATAEPEASATITPAEIHLGERARLAVTIANLQGVPAPALPAIEGLTVRSAGQQMSMSIVNGATTVNVTHTFLLEPSRSGDFTIPPLRIDAGGRALTTEAVTLHVLAAGEPSRLPPPRAPQAGTTGDREPVSLEILLPRREMFVGEVVPAKLRLLIRDGLRVTDASQPTLEAKAFTVNRKPERQPDQTTTTIDGVRYISVNFPISLSPVAAGEQTFEARMELRAILPRTQGRGGAFNDPFGSLFGLAGEPRKLEAIAPTATVRVLPLPDEGRPADYTGAIGRFSLTASAEPTRSTLGDPIAVKITVAGDGNFDRVVLPPVESDRDWKVYPENATFTPTDELGLSGRKTFEQALVPQRATLKALPIRRFSYFDPETRRYATLSTEPIALTIAPSAERPGAARVAAGTDRSAASGADGFELAPNEIALGDLVGDLRPLATRPSFLAAQSLPLIGLALAFVWARRRDRRMASESWRRAAAARPIIRAQIAEMSKAAEANDRAAFFAAARRAVQEAVAARYGLVATALTPGEIEACLAAPAGDGGTAAATGGASGATIRAATDSATRDAGGGAIASSSSEPPGATTSLIDDVRALFAEADAASYAGIPTGPVATDPWRERVLRILRDLESA